MKKKTLTILSAAATLAMVCSLGTACSGTSASDQEELANETAASQEDAGSQSDEATSLGDNDSLYQEAQFDDTLIQYPSDWKVVENDGVITMSEDGTANVPFITIEKVGVATPASDYMAIQSDAFRNRYGNQMAMPPEIVTTTIGGMDLIGFTAKYSAEDASATIAHEEYAEVIDDTLYNFTCEYVCSDSETQHEDESTPLAFMRVIETMKIKAE